MIGQNLLILTRFIKISVLYLCALLSFCCVVGRIGIARGTEDRSSDRSSCEERENPALWNENRMSNRLKVERYGVETIKSVLALVFQDFKRKVK